MRIVWTSALALACIGGCGDAGTEDAPPAPLVCAEATGAEIDLVPHARLEASGTRSISPSPWPREAEDAIATIRDDDAATSWKPPSEGGVVSIDLQPWLGRPIALATIELHPPISIPSARVHLLEACGAPPLRTLEWSEPSAALDLAGICAACVEVEVAEGSTELHGLSLTSRDGSIEVPRVAASDVRRPAESFDGFGVIEGFYGVPWSFRERRHMLATIARIGFDTYLYGPKNDPLHRDRWRDPYPEPWLDEFAQLAALASELDVALFYAITPFVDYAFDDEGDYAALLAKLQGFGELGVAGVALFADDIELEAIVRVDGALGAQHADVVNRLRDDLRQDYPDLLILFVPTAYSDARVADFEDGPGYLTALRALAPDVSVMWTGADTFNPSITAADLGPVTGWVGRAPLLWDNYWANDGGDDLFGRVLLAPLSGRSSDLVPAVEGVTFNMSIQGGLSRLAVATAATRLREAGELDAAAAREAAAGIEAELAFGVAADTRRDTAVAALVMAVFEANTTATPRYAGLDADVEELRGALDQEGVPVDEVRAVLLALAELAVMRTTLQHSGLSVDLVDELAFPLTRTEIAADFGLAILSLLGERLAGESGSEARAEALAAVRKVDTVRFRFEDDALRALLADAEDLPLIDRGFVAVEAAEPVPTECVAGRELVWRPFEATADEVSVFGLPGSAATAGTIRWTPPYSGTFVAVAVAIRADQRPGWAVRRFQLVCGIERR